MARNGDPNESDGAMPRAEFANSAGSQFFICLDYANTKQLDRRYTAFGKVIAGLDVAKKIGQSKISDPTAGRPETATMIRNIEVDNVTVDNDPYKQLPTTRE